MSSKRHYKILNRKAWGDTALCLSFIALMLLPVAASAQSGDFSNRLNRLENEIETLNRAVYRGEKPPTQIYNTTDSAGAGTDSQATAQMEVRLQQIETQMRDLTGRVEEQVYTINQLKNDIKFLQTQLNSKAEVGAPKDTASGVTRTPAARLEPNNTIENVPANPLNLDLSAQEPSGMQTASPIQSTSEATAQYEAAYAFIKDRKYDEARSSFEEFLKEHPNHVLSANAQYWLGETYYVGGEFEQAAKRFAQGFQQFPDSAKSPDMLLKLGLSLANMDKTEEACIALEQLPVKFKAGPQNILTRGQQEMDRLNCSS